MSSKIKSKSIKALKKAYSMKGSTTKPKVSPGEKTPSSGFLAFGETPSVKQVNRNTSEVVEQIETKTEILGDSPRNVVEDTLASVSCDVPEGVVEGECPESIHPPSPSSTSEISPTSSCSPSAAPTPQIYYYGKVYVIHPTKMETARLIGTKKSYWSYEFRTIIGDKPVSVRRRYNEVVALENRLRSSLPGAIIPPKPEKSDIFGVGGDDNSLGFARSLAKLLQLYFTQLIAHPLVGGVSHQAFHEFLTYPKGLGEVWNECSESKLKRMKAKSGAITDKIASRAAIAGRNVEDPNEELADMISNAYRMVDNINEASPKFEKMLTLVNDYGEAFCLTGMAFSKLCGRDITDFDAGMSNPAEMLALTALNDGRRLKKLGVDLQGGGMNVLVNERRRAKNEVEAFNDRKRAILATRRLRENANMAKRRYEKKKEKFIDEDKGQNDKIQNQLKALENETEKTEIEALKAKKEMEKVGDVLMGEIERLKKERRNEWFESVNTVAKDMHDCWKDRVQTWEKALEIFEKEYPDVKQVNEDVEVKVAKTVLF